MMKMNRILNAKKIVCKVMVAILLLAMLFSFAGCDHNSSDVITTTTTTSSLTPTTTTVAEVAVAVTDENGATVTDENGATVTSIIPASDVTTRVNVVTESNGATRTEVQTMATFTTSAKTTKATSADVATNTTTSAKKTDAAAKVTTKATTKAPTQATVKPATKTTTKNTTRTTTKAPTTTTQAHKCVWTKTDYKSPAVGVNGYYKYVCNSCGDTWTKDLPGFSYGTATPAEVQAYANQYLMNKGFKINTSVSPWTTPCGFNSPMRWSDGDTLGSLIPYIELHIETALEMRGFDATSVGAPVTAYAEVPTVLEGVTYYSAGAMYICFY